MLSDLADTIEFLVFNIQMEDPDFVYVVWIIIYTNLHNNTLQ